MRIFLLLLLTACTVPEAQTIRLSSRVTATYDLFQSLSNPYYFAVSVDGFLSGYSYCRETMCYLRGARQLAIEDCRSRVKETRVKGSLAKGGDCVIIANSHRIIYPGEIVFSP